MKSERTDDGQALCEVETQLPPLKDVGSGQAQEVAGARIVDVQRRSIQVAWPPGLGANLATLVDEGQMRGVFVPCLILEV